MAGFVYFKTPGDVVADTPCSQAEHDRFHQLGAFAPRPKTGAEARAEIDLILERIPQFSAAYVLDYSPMIDSANFRHMVEGLHKAGLPE